MPNPPTFESIEASLRTEYPSLIACEIRVDMRLPAGPDRLSNAYLVASNGSVGIPERFIAKRGHSASGTSGDILPEWRATRLAREHGVPVPCVLLPHQPPSEYLLLELLEGKNAQIALDDGASPEELFRWIGKTMNLLHRVPETGFGESSGSWSEWIHGRFLPKLPAMRTILGADRAAEFQCRFAELTFSLTCESDQPRLIHRDIYLSNFIVDPADSGAAIIDFGMACGGRPLYDLAKFYILDLYQYPEARDAFLGAYYFDSRRPPFFPRLMRLYLYVELSGMIRFFEAVGQTQALTHAKRVLDELLDNQGQMVDLIA